ncbi:MAG: hypothetical protein ACI8P3_001014 [Saprospiraceae bacterium]
MLSLFRTNQIAFNLLLIVYILLIRGSAIFVTPAAENFTGQGVLSDWLNGLWGTTGPMAVSIGIGVVFFQALLINIVVAKFRVATTLSLFPGLFYALLASIFPEFLALSPALLANTFFILALWELFETYRKNNIAGNIFNIGFWLGIASLFYFSAVVFLVLAFIGLNVLRAFNLKELLMLLIGFLVPYLIGMVYFFWNDELGFFFQNYLLGKFSFLDFHYLNNLQSYIKLGVVAVLSLGVIISFNDYYAKRNIQTQKNITVIFWALFIAVVSFVFQTNIQVFHFLIFTVPLGILLSFNFLKLSPSIAEAAHLLLFAAVLIWQFNPLWLR